LALEFGSYLALENRMHAHTSRDQDVKKGAVEGTKPSDPNPGNPNAPGIDENGNPADPVAISEDVIGANEDGTEG
jgi:hypothetical protein